MNRDEGQFNLETVISGSFRKSLKGIGLALGNFEKAGIKVRAPGSKEAVDPSEEFVMLATDDPNKPPHHLEAGYMREINKASFLYVVDSQGYVGQSAATEMAYAGIKSLPVVLAGEIEKFSSDIPEEAQEILRKIVSAVVRIEDITKEKMEEIKSSFKTENLSKEEKDILFSLIRKLFQELKSSLK